MDRVILALLWLMVFIIPWEEWLTIVAFSTLIRLVGYIAVAMLPLALIVKPSLRRPPLALCVAGLFVVWCALSLAWSVAPDRTLGYVFTMLQLLTFAWMIWEFADTHQRQLALMNAFIMGCIVSMLAIYIEYIREGEISRDVEGRLTSAGMTGSMNENTMAVLLAMSIPVAVYLAMHPTARRRGPLQIAYWFYVPFAGIAALLTGSRAGAMAVAYAVVLTTIFVGTMVLSGAGRRKAANVLVVATFLISLVGMGIYIPRVVDPRTLARFEEWSEADTFKSRVDLWQFGYTLWKERPIQGFGAAGFLAETVNRGRLARIAHNTFIEIAADLGTVGLLIFTSWLVLVGWRVLRLPWTEMFFWMAVFGAWLFGALSGDWETSKATWCFFTLASAQAAMFARARPARPPTANAYLGAVRGGSWTMMPRPR